MMNSTYWGISSATNLGGKRAARRPILPRAGLHTGRRPRQRHGRGGTRSTAAGHPGTRRLERARESISGALGGPDKTGTGLLRTRVLSPFCQGLLALGRFVFMLTHTYAKAL